MFGEKFAEVCKLFYASWLTCLSRIQISINDTHERNRYIFICLLDFTSNVPERRYSLIHCKAGVVEDSYFWSKCLLL